jgi:CMP-N-acetylneuraminic acid synthetase
MRKIAVVPVKEKSERVQNKNFKVFANGLSLLEFKLKQIIESKCFDAIYVSSNSKKANEIAENLNVTHIFRPDEFCNNLINWSDVIHYVIESLPEEPDAQIAWCHTTSPLFDRYNQAVKQFDELLVTKSHFNGLVAVTDFKEFLVTEKSRPYNYNWGIWHDYSQNIDRLYKVTGALFIAQKAEMIKNRYVISKNPLLFQTNSFEAIDIDTNFDFNLAQLLFNNKTLFSDAQ